MPGGQGIFPALSVDDNLRLAGWLHRGNRPPGRGPGRGAPTLPHAGRAHRPARGQPLRRRAADAGAGPDADEPAPAAPRSTSCPSASPPRSSPSCSTSSGRPPAGHGGDRRAVRQRRPRAGRTGRVHGEGRGPLQWPDRRAGRAARPPPLGLHPPRGPAPRAADPERKARRRGRDAARAPRLSGSRARVPGRDQALRRHPGRGRRRPRARAGQILGLIGQNGAGKTTLFDCISGFLPTDAGASCCGVGRHR